MKNVKRYDNFLTENVVNDKLIPFLDEMNDYFGDHQLSARLMELKDFTDGGELVDCVQVMISSIHNEAFYINDSLIEHFYQIIDNFNNEGLDLFRVKHIHNHIKMIYNSESKNRWGVAQPVDSIWDIQDLDWSTEAIFAVKIKFKK
jgi:hypothetical protein